MSNPNPVHTKGSQFESNNEVQKKAQAGRKKSKDKEAATQAITKSSAIKSGKRVTPEVQEYIREELLKPTGSSNYMKTFIKAFLKEAKEDPNSRCGQLLASAMFSDQLLTHLDEEANKQMAKDREFLIYRIRNTLYEKQQELFDNTIDQTIIAICTRRAGKTECNARLLLRDVIEPGHNALYLNRSFDNAVRQLGKPLDELLMKLDMPHRGQVSSGYIEFDNGSTITLSGYNNKGDIDRYRGGHYSLIILDEISHLRSPKVLIEEVLEPSQVDYGKEAQMVFTGTPPRNKVNYARELWNNPKIKHFHWSFMDNPFIPDKDTVIDRICEKHGCTKESAFIQREYFGNMDAIDEDSMVFRGYRTYNELPKNVSFEKAYVGVDFGFEDAAAVISGVAYNKTLYIVDQWSERHQPISVLCEEVKKQYENLKKMPLKQQPWVITDTNVKEGAYELQATYKIPNVFCAYKYDKDVAIEQLAEFMRTDKILIPNKEDGILYVEAENTLWKRDDETDEIIHEIDDEQMHPNALMALLYVSRQFAYEVLNIVDVNKPAKEITNAQEFVQQYETFEDNRTPTGILELGDGETARHFIR